MHKYKIIIEYDGSEFVGWQKQENGNSIQESIEKAIYKLSNENVNVFGSGRTDSGVHARGQVAHFELKKEISIDKIRDGLNQHLRPLPISILESKKVNNDFHARFSAKLRFYEYLIINRRSPLTFNKKQVWCIFKKLDIIKIKEAIPYFIGKHDFNAFRSIDCQSSSSIKTINNFSLEHNEELLKFSISAKSFLHSQVRIIVGTLIEVGKGKIPPEEILKILESKDRSKAGATAPAHGLYLLKIDY